MRTSTIAHPAMLGHRDTFVREVERIQAHSQAAGLFDLPVDELGLHGQTVPEHQVLRSFQMLGEAFGLPEQALLQWHRLFAFEEMPPLGGALVRGCGDLLADLMLRTHTFAMYQDRQRRGATHMRVWARSAPLQKLLRAKAKLLGALEHPVETHQLEAGRTRLLVLGAIEIGIDAAQREVDVAVAPMLVSDRQRRKALRWSPVIWLAKWLRYWLFCRADLSIAIGTPLHQVLRWLLRDCEVRRGIERAARELFAHPSWPRDAMALAQRAYGQAGMPRPHCKTITWCWRHPALYEELLARAPHLVHVMPSVHNLGEVSLALDSLRSLKALLMGKGLTAAGWRWLAVNPPPLTRAAAELERTCPQYVVLMARALGAAGIRCVPSDRFLPYLFDELFEQHDRVCTLGEYPWLIDAAWRHCEGLGDDPIVFEGWLRHSFTPAIDWVLTEGWQADANQRRGGWPAVERAWKKATGQGPHRRANWPAPFEFLECGELVACSITNTAELQAEGEAMGHCIVDYLDTAIAGRFLPFSVRGPDGKRVATFSLARKRLADPWAFQQCMGPLNGKFVHPAREALIERALVLAVVWQRVGGS